MSFSTSPAPGAATLSTPSGNITTNYTPTYTWSQVVSATSYYLWVDGPSGNVILQWYTSAQANCNGTTCSVTPTTTLGGGTHTWWVQTWNPAGYGPWSAGMSFSTTVPTVPGAATLSTPTGGPTTNYNPTYTWNEVASSTWYYLWVDGPSENVIKQWYTSAQAACNGTTCSVTPATTLPNGSYTWWIQTWNTGGLGPWSAGKPFSMTIPAAATALVANTGNPPTYTWNEVPGATYYYLWVDRTSGNVIKQWFTSAQANCNGTTCSVTPATTLASGTYTWWVQTWNPVGYGPWSTPATFTR